MSLLGWCGFDFIGRAFGEETCAPEEVGDPPNFQPSILVDGGIAYVSFFKKLLIPSYARIENVRKGCYKTVEPKREKCERRKTCAERRCKRKRSKDACEKNSKAKADLKDKEVVTKVEPKIEEPAIPGRPSDRACRLEPRHRCSILCRDDSRV